MCLTTSVNAAAYKYCRAAVKGELVHCSGSFIGCRSHSTSLPKAFTTRGVGGASAENDSKGGFT